MELIEIMTTAQKVKMLETRFIAENIMYDHSISTVNGESHYFKPASHTTFLHIMKIRISGHSVMNINRLRDEEHFHGNQKHLDRLIEVIKSYN